VNKVLSKLRDWEYCCENYEQHYYGVCTKEEIQQSMYEYMYFRDLADFLETELKTYKYSNKELAIRTQEYLDKMYAKFEKNSAKSLETKKKATMLKQEAFKKVFSVLDELLKEIV
jgi:hypothetical protein